MKEKSDTTMVGNGQKPDLDIKAEVVAAGWLEAGLPAERLLARPISPFKRRFSPDIAAVQDGELNRFRGRIMELNRSGVYDHLPESLLHLRTQPTPTVTQKVADVKREREKEMKSRLFFLPLEQEIFLAKIRNEQRESRAFHLRPGVGFFKTLREFWQIPAFVPESWLLPISIKLPLLGRGSLARLHDLTIELLGTLTNYDIQLQSTNSQSFEVPSPWRLSQSTLGAQTLLGGELQSYCPQYQITLHATSSSDPPVHFLPGGSRRAALDWLLGFLLPAGGSYEIKVQGVSSEFFLADHPSTDARLDSICL